ncbi:flavin-containing monooxygenase [Gordonia phthalatica]|uniref:Pyridine nucleotide-disulfide oxidoreductase n=1 Tax=Gordonia phthalatica TaxID=1136941 RepID=A0A0N9NC62_9ACTN|nr:NAD(P)/FAD-dependent oxidoreductase [Gordonia phthalatica]ALG85244.1 pyridine nucleotide-disulfide oxidoreductase [Gordonia phthalatica]
MNGSTGDSARGAAVIERRVVVIGAGQAGLSTAYYLQHEGLIAGEDFEVLDANLTPGGAWSHRWDALTFDWVNGIYDLPGSRLEGADPAEPAREVIKRYYGGYEVERDLRVARPWRVVSVERDVDDRFMIHAEHPDGAVRIYRAGAVISGTGTWDRPYVPWYPGRFDGPQLHTREFPEPSDFAGKRVLVVGGGISAVEFVVLLDEAGATPIWSTRTPPRWRDVPFDTSWGLEVENSVAARTRAGLRPLSVVAATGLPRAPRLAPAIDSGVLTSRGPIARLLAGGVEFADGSTENVDVILWATGFRASIGHLAGLSVRERTGGVLMADDDVSVVKVPGLFLVGYGRSASTLGATRAGRRAARAAVAATEGREAVTA